MAPVRKITSLDVFILFVGLWLASKGVRILRRRSKTTRLKGPASRSWIFGVARFLRESGDEALVYEEWAEQYGVVFRMPMALGSSRVVLCDPKAIQHFYSKETYGYVQNATTRIFISDMLGKGIIWAEGDSHKRQRKALTPAFSNAAIRKLAPVFFDSAYKVKEAWDAILGASENGEAVIDVQDWMNHVSLDSVGVAGFSHDFGTLEGKHSTIAEVFDSFGKLKLSFFQILIFILSGGLPFIAHTPSMRKTLVKKFSIATDEISREMLERTRMEKDEGKDDHSIIGLLIKATNGSSALHISEDEVMAQIKTLIIAGYETTSISLTWALIELSKDQSVQVKLREELASHFGHDGDPTYDQLTVDFPYLDAVVHEVLRLHAPIWETPRVAVEDDIIPLSVPLQTADNKTVDRISIAAGQKISIPIRTMNRSTSVWGADAKEFKPQRWLEEGGIQGKAKEIQAYRHLLTFVDGPRACLGKTFALTEFKATLSVLIRNYKFKLRDGPDTKFEMGNVIIPRPKVVGEDGCCVPLCVCRVD